MLTSAIAATLTIISFAMACPTANTGTTIVVAAEKRGDAGIALAVDDLATALKTAGQDAVVAYRRPSDPLPPENVILVGEGGYVTEDVKDARASESFHIRPLEHPGRSAIAVEGAPRGMMYGVFKLAERIRLGQSPWMVKVESAPAFPLRIFSEEGQLLDIPDRAYYADQPPYVNEKRMREEVDQLKQLMRHVAAQGFNAFCLLHLNVEEYIDYRYLDKKVYPKNDPHRLRSPIFCKYLKELCDEAHALHLEFHLQVYEFVYPPQLGELYTLQLDHPDLKKVLNARYRELFQRVPLDGLIVTAAEQAPRCGYVPKILWSGGVEQNRGKAGQMALLYHNACTAAGGRCIFRLWHVASDAETAAEVFRAAAAEVMFETKHTGGDFFITYPLTTIVTKGLTQKQPTVVTFDTFRQYDGWSRLFCYMKQWGPRARVCRDNGVVGINVWGPWSPACNVRDINGIQWAGHWNNFRTFLHGFTPGQADVYLIARLAWDPDADVAQIARDFCALHVGRANSEAAAEALLATEDAFGEEYVKRAHPCHFKLAMVYQPRDAALNIAFQANSLAEILASNARALAAVERMEGAFAETDPAYAYDVDKYTRFKEGIEKTALYLRTFYTFREGVWRSHAANKLTNAEQKANAAALAEVQMRLKGLFDQWQRWPEEAGFWRVTWRHGKPPAPAQRFFEVWNCEERRTMETDAERFGK